MGRKKGEGMQKLLYAVVFFILSAAAHSDERCFDYKKGKAILKELEGMVEYTLCAEPLPAERVRSGINAVLPRVMNKAFLGVDPPDNWQAMVNEVQQTCLKDHGNLCSDAAQREVEACVSAQLPALILFWAPWFAEHCEAINKAVILNWKQKKPQVQQWINAFKQQAIN
ncbi:Uncharacterised protein [Legionella taurinensis]|nr:Uncharacterised protein [Legionella taurinensis]